MGSEIIEAVKSGLGLIGDLANEFLNGFNALVWDATTSKLTTVGVFAFVMLGVSVSFAVIKLVLNLLRGNTGI